VLLMELIILKVLKNDNTLGIKNTTSGIITLIQKGIHFSGEGNRHKKSPLSGGLFVFRAFGLTEWVSFKALIMAGKVGTSCAKVPSFW